jgi:hypothetical protein
LHFLAKNPKNHGFFRKKSMFFFGFLGFFPSEGIASDATWMYYVKTKKPPKTLV